MPAKPILALALLCLMGPQTSWAEPSLRVRVIEQARSVLLSGKSLKVEDRPVASELRATAAQGRVKVGAVARPGPVRVQGSDGVSVDGRRFPGKLALVPRSDGGMDVVNVVPLEPYVERIIVGEVYADWPAEVLKAQAVVARTYALHQRARRTQESFDVEGSVISQRYASGRVPESVRRAAAATRGEYLVYQREPILAVFHASAGGRTASASEVWGLPVPYLASVSSPDDGGPDYFWSFEISLADLVQALNDAGVPDSAGGEVEVQARSESGRVEELQVGKARLSGHDLRQVLGGRAIRSTLFEVRIEGGKVRFLGSGAGHGVGLSQWGARELAGQGKTYRSILEHYYPGTQLVRLSAGREVSSLR